MIKEFENTFEKPSFREEEKVIDAAGEKVVIVTRTSVVQVKLRLQYQLLLFMLSTVVIATP